MQTTTRAAVARFLLLLCCCGISGQVYAAPEESGPEKQCLLNLRRIELAKEQAALENQWLRGTDCRTPEEVIEFCQQNLAAFKVPRYLEFRESLPKTPSERVQKQKLKEEKEDLTSGCYDRVADRQSKGAAS